MKAAFLCAGAGLIVCCGAWAQTPPRYDSIPGYLTARALPDAAKLLGPPPPNGSGTKAGDVATYEATRRLKGTPRWDLAVRDAQFGPAAILEEFSCAAGMKMDQAADPQTYHLLRRIVVDSLAVQNQAKLIYKRPRPFVENGGPMCTPDDKTILTSYSYPSGHSTFSWTVGLVMAQIMPERATDILARARSYGESRVICGVHYESDVKAGRAAAAALFSVLQDNAAFQADLARARAELTAARTSAAAPDGAQCALEAQASASPVW